MGEKANIWRNEPSWPLERAKNVTYYLNSKGKANTSNGNGSLEILSNPVAGNYFLPLKIILEFDQFVYDPLNPVPTHGGCIIDAGKKVR
jgi:predicted acyl esterase